jgi:hypothetical protein
LRNPGLPTEDLSFPLFPSGSIRGRIVDANGDPVENALVHLIRKGVTLGKAGARNYRWAYTNDLGEYRFGQVPAGAYYLAVNGQPWYADSNPRWRPAGGLHQKSGSDAFIPSYYPGTPDILQATPIELTAGQEARGNFTLTPTRGAKITVNCKGCPQSATLQLIYDGIGNVEEFQQTTTIFNGRGVLPSVPPGQYFVRVTSTGSTMSAVASARVNVQSSDLTIELNASEAPSVSGVLSMDGGAPLPKGLSVRVIHTNRGRVTVSPVGSRGDFSITGIVPGQYQIVALGGGVYTKSVRVGTRDAKILDVPDTGISNLQIVAGTGGGSVAGVVSKDGKAIYGVLAVLCPEGLPNEPDRYRSFKTDSDGSFEWSNLPPGSYRLFAVDKYSFEYKVPEKLRPYLKDARQIQIGPGDSFRENLSVIE